MILGGEVHEQTGDGGNDCDDHGDTDANQCGKVRDFPDRVGLARNGQADITDALVLRVEAIVDDALEDDRLVLQCAHLLLKRLGLVLISRGCRAGQRGKDYQAESKSG
ncbi:hypothetical protein D3C77_685280 [compost metagenome]